MSATTIEVPADQVEALRESLTGRRAEADQRVEADRLLQQLPDSARGHACELTGSRAVLWNAVYDSLCAAAEQLAEECNDYWRGTDPRAARASIANVSARLELLVGLGEPPTG